MEPFENHRHHVLHQSDHQLPTCLDEVTIIDSGRIKYFSFKIDEILGGTSRCIFLKLHKNYFTILWLLSQVLKILCRFRFIGFSSSMRSCVPSRQRCQPCDKDSRPGTCSRFPEVSGDYRRRYVVRRRSRTGTNTCIPAVAGRYRCWVVVGKHRWDHGSGPQTRSWIPTVTAWKTRTCQRTREGWRHVSEREMV